MIFSSIVIALLSSIDSLGIGITYSLIGTKLSRAATYVLFFLTLFTTSFAMLFGNIIKNHISDTITNNLGALFLILIGVYMILKARGATESDFDHSKTIDLKEGFFLGIALSLDSIGIVISATVAGICTTALPILLSFFQILFLKIGSYVGTKLGKCFSIPDRSWSILSGFCLLVVGTLKLLV